MIDLKQNIAPIQNFILKEITKFKIEHGTPKSIGIYSCPNYGWVSLNFNVNKTVTETFNNCPDFDYVEFSFIEFESWEEEYEKENPIIINHLGDKEKLSYLLGDEAFKKPFFEMLVFAVSKIETKISPIEILIQILDSNFVKKIK